MHRDKPVGLELSGCSGQFGSDLTPLLVYNPIPNRSPEKENSSS